MIELLNEKAAEPETQIVKFIELKIELLNKEREKYGQLDEHEKGQLCAYEDVLEEIRKLK